MGKDAEWYVQCGPGGSSLARYGNVYFDNATASTDKNVTLNAGTGNLFSMLDDGGKIVSSPTIENETLIKCEYTG